MEYETGELIRLGAEYGLYLFAGVFLLHALILAYHWFRYGTNKGVVLMALLLYLGGGILMLLIMSVSANAL